MQGYSVVNAFSNSQLPTFRTEMDKKINGGGGGGGGGGMLNGLITIARK